MREQVRLRQLDLKMNHSSQPEETDFEAALARMMPPAVPADALVECPELVRSLRRLDRHATIAVLAGLQTEPQFQANHIRLEFAIRLVLALAEGTRRPARGDIHRLLNVSLERARVTLLEDPIEDFFVDSVPTPVGDFLLLPGIWEQAGFFTETVLAALAHLPDAEGKRAALRSAIALMQMSTALVNRA